MPGCVSVCTFVEVCVRQIYILHSYLYEYVHTYVHMYVRMPVCYEIHENEVISIRYAYLRKTKQLLTRGRCDSFDMEFVRFK